MEHVSNLLFWISNGLLVPVIVGLLFFFVKSIFMLGGFHNRYMQRRKMYRTVSAEINRLDAKHLPALGETLAAQPDSAFIRAARELAAGNGSEAVNNRIVSEYEIQADRELGEAKILTKFGPILGLMGTLIPMGPALMGLSTGDISTMAYNMQVAFATTVIGLFAGAIGFVLLQIKQRWATQDLTLLDYVSAVAIEAHQPAGPVRLREMTVTKNAVNQ
ncbi:MotA/TolQ/ExbB proton channel family protein [uncultured Rikenella sp.]|uniref:MotA/TolQ/ExbB proton channel family protein n=1 Tax=uncultured Rikenella sp. TaxID=368003 RepID=UPI0025DCC3E9|nr:MotA/TolQ/ExbB proton channel family protein [uncultured Rikenella sp.]